METTELLLILYGPVIGYLALTSIQQGKKITTIWNKVEGIERLESRFDIFLKNEIDALKEIAKK
jgi:hypothetical protein